MYKLVVILCQPHQTTNIIIIDNKQSTMATLNGGKAKKKLSENELKIKAALSAAAAGEKEWQSKFPCNEKGKYMSLMSENPDGRKLMVYVKYNCVDGMTPSKVVKKYIQFKGYSLSTISSALGRHCKTLCDNVSEHASELLSPCKSSITIFIIIVGVSE
jgi:hypothetical protein